MNRRLLFLGTSLLLLAGCTFDTQTERDDGQVPVRLSVSQEGAVTRAADGLYTAATGFDGTESVEVYVNSASKHATFSVGAPNAAKESELSGTLYYPTTGDINLFAVYPAASVSSHTVKYDQTTPANYKASDLMYAKKTVTQAQKESTQNLAFEHQLVKLKVEIVKAADVSQVTQVVMNNVLRKATVSLSASALTLSSLTTATGDDATGGDNILVSSGESLSIIAQTYTYAVVFPVQSWDDDEFITVTADGKTATYKLTKDNFAAGSEYTITLNINAAALDNTVTIDNWTGTAGTCTVEPANYTLRDIKMNPLWYLAENNMTNTEVGPTATLTMGSSPEEAYFYSNEDAMKTFAAQTTNYSDYKNAGKNVNGVNYHLPVLGEWLSIMPSKMNSLLGYVSTESPTAYKPAYLTPKFGYNKATQAGVVESSYYVFAYDSRRELHAIRFLGTPYCSAWRWVWDSARLTIYATLIDIVEDSESAASAWYTENWSDVTWGNDEFHCAVMRSFYGCGQAPGTGDTPTTYQNNAGLFWSTTEHETLEDVGYCMDFHIGFGLVNTRNLPLGLAARLFRDN